MTTVASLVRRARHTRQLTLRAAAAKIGVSHTYLMAIESGAVVPSPRLCGRLAEVLELDLHTLLTSASAARIVRWQAALQQRIAHEQQQLIAV